MSGPVSVDDHDAIEGALRSSDLVPPASTDSSAGATITLRNAMARFSGPDRHPERRAHIDALIGRLDVTAAERLAGSVARDLLAAGASEHTVVRVAPTRALLALLGPGPSTDSVVDDVEAVVRVIGRGEPAEAAADAATERLLAAVPAGDDPVAVVSLLYQNFDATTALLRNTLAARATGTAPEPAVRATRRVAVVPTEVDGTVLAAGDEIVLEIGRAGLPFGAGPHECPGRALAEAFVRGVVSALDAPNLGQGRAEHNV